MRRCPRCDSEEGLDLSVTLCSPCLAAWRASGKVVRGNRLETQPAIWDWIEHSEIGPSPGPPYKPGRERGIGPASATGLVSLCFRIPRPHLEAVKALSRSTRVSQSNYMREALADLLAKYEEHDE